MPELDRTPEGLQIHSGLGFILGFEALAQLPDVEAVPSVGVTSRHINEWGFESDRQCGRLARFPKGSFVAYHKGFLVGQSADREKLEKSFAGYHGSSNVDYFQLQTKS